jgi:hypothetical protein
MAAAIVKHFYETGDTCWFDAGMVGASNEPVLSEGPIASWLDLPAFGQRHYVIKMGNPEGLELRDALLMTDDPERGCRSAASVKLPSDMRGPSGARTRNATRARRVRGALRAAGV